MAARKSAAEKKAEQEKELDNTRRELFCRYYTQSGENFGNATLAYAEAYGFELDTLSEINEHDDNGHEIKRTSEYDRAYHSCSVLSSKLLRNVDIQARLTVLLNELLKDEVVDSELAKVIRQDTDLSSKVNAVREYNKVRGRIIDKTQLINRLPFGETDLSLLIATLPSERQDHFYAVITELVAEAERVRSDTTAQGSGTR